MEKIPDSGKVEEVPLPVEEEDKPTPIPFKLQYTIAAVCGTYVIRRPSGPIGAKHFSLLSRCVPSQFDSEGLPMYSPADEERQYAAYEKWVPTVLKHIIITCPIVDGVQITPDTVPPEDQWSLFQAIGSLMRQSEGKLFRFVDA